jgi:hypothetical protein
MAIDTRCPHCQKAYRLRDELAGKRVTCGNPECRKSFTVEARPDANGSPSPARPAARTAAPAARPAPPVDAEALAAAAFADEAGTAAPGDKRIIHLTCSMCDHKWDVPWAMQGKNVLCPECRYRMKVPEQKTGKVDWRDPNAGGPSLRKIEKLEGVVATTDAGMISGETLRKTGVIEEDIEPRPRWHYVAAAALALMVVGGITYGILALLSARKEGKQELYMAEAVQEMTEAKDIAIPDGELRLFRATLHLQAGEFAVRQSKPQDAVNHFAAARQELAASTAAGRDLLFVELALAQAKHGGTDEEVNQKQSRTRWVPAAGRPTRGRSEGRVDTVLDELKHTFQAMKGVPLDVRIWAMRRLSRELAERGQADLAGQLTPAAFPAPGEESQGRAEAAVETLKVSGRQEKVREVAATLAGTVQSADAGLATVVALAQALDPPVPLTTTIQPPSAAGDVAEGPRLAYTTLYLLQNKPAEALELAKRPGPTAGQLRALALVAEWSPDPGPAVEAALGALSSAKKGPPPATDLVLLRLAREAGRANQPDKAEVFVKAQSKEDVRIWSRAEALRSRLVAGHESRPVDFNLAPVPDNTKDHRIGHGWARLTVARHNAKVADDPRGVLIEVNSWAAGSYRPLGKAGLALGLQDRDER